MLTVVRSRTPEAVARIRSEEFSYLDERGLCYLDYTGAALPARSQLAAQHAIVAADVFGNPHSQHSASRRSTDAIEASRARVLTFLDAPDDEYAVIFTANTSAAIKLAAESFPFRAGSSLVLSRDNHNSVNGIREFAARAGARVRTISLTPELRLARPFDMLATARGRGPHLFAFPAQSNFSGVKHRLSLVAEAQRRGFTVLLDAAAFVPSNALSLRRIKPDFVALSMYKLFGFPAGVGALVARRDALQRLQRPWFAGGTVEWASVGHQIHRLRDGSEGFEDGTPNFSGIAALAPAFDFIERFGMANVSAHVTELTSSVLAAMRTRRHANGKPVFRIYGPASSVDRGGTIAFNLLNASGGIVSHEAAEAHAARAGVAIRGGCFCNPGASEAAFGFPTAALRRCLEESRTGVFSTQRLGQCLGDATPVGALRISVGLANIDDDVHRGVDTLAAFVGA